MAVKASESEESESEESESKEKVQLGQRFGEESSDPRYDTGAAQDVASSIFDLAHNLGQNLLSTRSQKFEVFSPTSIAAALNLVLLGSRGETFNELLATLGYSKCKFETWNFW